MEVVQKYGGTSVGSIERIKGVAERVARHHQLGHKIAVVVSAMSGETNRLVELMREVNPKASAHCYDMAVATGEQVTIGLMSAAIESLGIPSQPFLAHQLGILTDGNHAKARIQYIDTQPIRHCWAAGGIPVIAGFQGMAKDKSVTTLGRGGSDTSAVALAAALKSDLCEINTDVDGVYTADPRIVEDAKLIDVLDFGSALELASLGSKVLYLRSVEIAAKYRVPLVVRKTWDPDEGRSTRIMEFDKKQELEAPVVSGVTLDRDVARLTVRGFHKESPVFSDLFAALGERNVNVDIIVHQRHENGIIQSVGFTVKEGETDLATDAIESLKSQEMYKGISVQVDTGLAKVSVVGLGMVSHSGVASRVFDTMARQTVEIGMVSTSEIKISLVVRAADGERATKSLHRAFFH